MEQSIRPISEPLTDRSFLMQKNDKNQTLVIALSASPGIWGAVNLLESCGNDKSGTKFRCVRL